MEYRLSKSELLNTLRGWSKFIKREVRVIACGGTAMTLLNVKASTKDIDFMVPDDGEYLYLTKILSDIGYQKINPNRWRKDGELFEIDLYAGNTIHTTELLESPLKEENHFFLEQIGRLYLGVLNYYDLIASKVMRGTSVDFEDCLMLLKDQGGKINKDTLVDRYNELISFDISEPRIKGYLQSLIERWEGEEKCNEK